MSILNSTEVKSYLNITSTTYDSLINTFIPVVEANIFDICNHRFHDPYHWFYDYNTVFSSTSKTITLYSLSTQDWTKKINIDDTIDCQGSYFNNRTFTCTTRTSHVLTVSESVVNENTTDYNLVNYFYKCQFPENIKLIASKMIWWNIQNTTNVSGELQSESYGGYSVSYRDSGNLSYFGYPNSLISGLKRQVNSL